jgi:hypothetical protein
LLVGVSEEASAQRLLLSAKLVVFHTHFLHLHQNQDADLSKVDLDLCRSLGVCKPQNPQGSDSRREVLKFMKTGRDYRWEVLKFVKLK